MLRAPRKEKKLPKYWNRRQTTRFQRIYNAQTRFKIWGARWRSCCLESKGRNHTQDMKTGSYIKRCLNRQEKKKPEACMASTHTRTHTCTLPSLLTKLQLCQLNWVHLKLNPILTLTLKINPKTSLWSCHHQTRCPTLCWWKCIFWSSARSIYKTTDTHTCARARRAFPFKLSICTLSRQHEFHICFSFFLKIAAQ